MKLTADTITDEQIRAFGCTVELLSHEHALVATALDRRPCGISEQILRTRARARLAEILNARAKEGK